MYVVALCVAYYLRGHDTSTSQLSSSPVGGLAAHLGQYIHRITAKRQIRRSQQSQRIKLVSEGSFRNRELGSVRPVQTVDAIGSEDTVLEEWLGPA